MVESTFFNVTYEKRVGYLVLILSEVEANPVLLRVLTLPDITLWNRSKNYGQQ